ncbi:hypothetical protein EWM64_g3840 [Hericium alpestre]|uniref:Galactokinase n=1 Tax=Hericium alpestre TaxID=135208 RepID=A0A4Z0A2S2_9AGAM|nr:hypothetical protein EWM64_g3840 [Hericium alpestre]
MAAQLPIPIYNSLDKLYADLGSAANHAVRWNHLTEEFEKRFGRKPAFIARAPGRVNLIGEHIDYALFPALPAAIERDILIACAPRASSSPGHVHAQNLHDKYTPTTFTPKRRRSVTEGPSEEEVHLEEWELGIDKKELRWESYVKAGYYGVLNRFFAPEAGSLQTHSPVPVDLLVTGTVPAGSGLSSSAAMVVASTLVFLAVNNKLEGISKGTLVEMAMENEKRVGVNSGGLDQAASVICTPASAIYVTFFPHLAASPVLLPGADVFAMGPRAVFILANSLVTSEKAVHARTRYNLRVVETLAAARILSNLLGVPVGARERLQLRHFVGRFGGEPESGWDGEDVESLKAALHKALEHVHRLKPSRNDGQEGLTLADMIALSGMSADDFHEVYLSWIDVEATHFQLFKRATHVFTETLRVLEFREVCLHAAASGATEDTLKRLGSIMDASMASCSAVCAGWGGCTVSLVAEDNVDKFIATLKATYPAYKDLEGEALAEVIFATKPSSGACLYNFGA